MRTFHSIPYNKIITRRSSISFPHFPYFIIKNQKKLLWAFFFQILIRILKSIFNLSNIWAFGRIKSTLTLSFFRMCRRITNIETHIPKTCIPPLWNILQELPHTRSAASSSSGGGFCLSARQSLHQSSAPIHSSSSDTHSFGKYPERLSPLSSMRPFHHPRLSPSLLNISILAPGLSANCVDSRGLKSCSAVATTRRNGHRKCELRPTKFSLRLVFS